MTPHASAARLGVAVVGLGGAVSTTAVAGIELLRSGHADTDGLPLAHLPEHLTSNLTPYDQLVFRGWDFYDSNLAEATLHHDVLSASQYKTAEAALSRIRPWPAVGNEAFCRNVTGDHKAAASSHLDAVEAIQADLERFKEEEGVDRLAMLNLASTEAAADPSRPVFASEEAFREGLAEDDPAIGPAILYAFAAIDMGVPYVNFTPSVAADVPALVQMANRFGVPVAGKDGKTGQTFLKTVIAPGLRDRALHVDGWYSTNILGNRDGEALRDKDSLASKIQTKGSVLDQILGYRVEDHIVNISYYRPRGDNKEAWDNIDVTGFLGQRMQLKVNFLCRDSILAAPLAIELARLADLAGRRQEGGVQHHLSTFFKSPMVPTADDEPEHALHAQHQMLLRWLEHAHATHHDASGDGAPAPTHLEPSEG